MSKKTEWQEMCEGLRNCSYERMLEIRRRPLEIRRIGQIMSRNKDLSILVEWENGTKCEIPLERQPEELRQIKQGYSFEAVARYDNIEEEPEWTELQKVPIISACKPYPNPASEKEVMEWFYNLPTASKKRKS